MKQCPKCQESFDDQQNFCDLDGTPLVDETALLRSALQHAETPGASGKDSMSLVMGFVGIAIGVILSLLVYVFLLLPSSDGNKASAATKQAPPIRANQVSASLPRETAPPRATEFDEERAPSPSPSPSSVASPSESASVATQGQPSPILDDGPISTSDHHGKQHGQAVIKMTDGASVEVDAVWEDKQGVWYRRGALVSFVDRASVAAITAKPTQEVSKP